MPERCPFFGAPGLWNDTDADAEEGEEEEEEPAETGEGDDAKIVKQNSPRFFHPLRHSAGSDTIATTHHQ